MDFSENIGESIAKLKEFFTNISTLTKDTQTQNEIHQKILSEILTLSSNGTDFSYYLPAITYLQDVADQIKSPSLKSIFENKKEISFDGKLIENPSYRSLLDTCLKLKNEFEEFKVKTNSAIPRLEALNVSLNTMLADEQSSKLELEQKMQKQMENHRKIVEDLRNRVTTRDQQIHELENKYDMLQNENVALAKSKGRNVDALFQELQKIKMDNEMKTEKIRVIEEQNRQNLLIYANEISQLKGAAPVPQALASPKNAEEKKTEENKVETLEEIYSSLFAEIDRKAIEVSVIESVNANIMESLEKRREFASEMIKSFGIEATGSNVIEALKAQIVKINDELSKSKEDFEKQKSEITALSEELKANEEKLGENKKQQTEELNTLNQQNEDKKHVIEGLKENIDKLAQEIDAAKEKQASLESEISLIDTQILEQKNINEKKNKELDELSADLSSKTNERDEIENTNTDISSKITTCQANIQTILGEIEEKKEQQKNLEEELSALNQRFNSLTKSKSDNEDMLNRLRASIEKQNTATEATLGDVCKLETKVAQVNENLQTRIQTIRDVASSMEAVCKEHAELMTKLTSLSESLQKELDDKTPFEKVLCNEEKE